MSLTKIELRDFKIYNNKKLDFKSNVNFITGFNGVGKTTILNSVFLFSQTKLLNNANFNEGIQKDKKMFSNEYTYKNNKYIIKSAFNLREFLINGGNVNKKEFSKKTPNSFYADSKTFIDFQYLESKRSLFIRKLLFSIDEKLKEKYQEIQRVVFEVKRIVSSSKNIETKRKLSKDKIITLINLQYEYLLKEEKLINDFISIFKNNLKFNFFRFNDSEIKWLYFFSPKSETSIDKNLIAYFYKNNLDAILNNYLSLPWIEKDIFYFRKNNNSIVNYFSRGQIKLIQTLLIFSILEIKYYKNTKDIIILLDDYLVDLDQENKISILKEFTKINNQVIITDPNSLVDNLPSKIKHIQL